MSKFGLITLQKSDAFEYVWRRLKRYQDIDLTFGLLKEKHRVPDKDRKNLVKQCQQIGYSIGQANEFSVAARTSGSATKALQAYYSLTALANAEILWNGTGEVSFDMRDNLTHRHGLDLHAARTILEFSASPQLSNTKQQVGLFGLWRQHSSHLPDYGKHVSQYQNSFQSGYRAFSNSDRLINFPAHPDAISLGQCLTYLPDFQLGLQDYDLRGNLLRSTREHTTYFDSEEKPSRHKMNVSIHPCPADLLTKAIEHYKFPAEWWSNIEVIEPVSGLHILLDIEDQHSKSYSGPECFPYSTDINYLLPDGSQLNEFGYYYVGLYICSMISRYYPQHWIKEIGKNSHVTFLIDDFVESALRRTPLLTLSQIESRVHIYE